MFHSLFISVLVNTGSVFFLYTSYKDWLFFLTSHFMGSKSNAYQTLKQKIFSRCAILRLVTPIFILTRINKGKFIHFTWWLQRKLFFASICFRLKKMSCDEWEVFFIFFQKVKFIPLSKPLLHSNPLKYFSLFLVLSPSSFLLSRHW